MSTERWVKATSTAHVGSPTIFLNMARADMVRRDEQAGETWISWGDTQVTVSERPEVLIAGAKAQLEGAEDGR